MWMAPQYVWCLPLDLSLLLRVAVRPTTGLVPTATFTIHMELLPPQMDIYLLQIPVILMLKSLT
jgi:hypothetical protein